MEEIIILNAGNVKIKKKDGIFKIEFKYAAYEIINSLLKTYIIKGGSSDDSYKSIQFKGESIKTLRQYQDEKKVKNGKKNMLVSEVAKMIRSLVSQLTYLIETEYKTILGYNPDEIIVINDEKFAFLGSELIADIDPEGTEMAMISCPFLNKNFFMSPELLNIKEIPALVHFKTSYFSLALLIIYCIIGNKEFYLDYLNEKHSGKLLNALDNHPISSTKIYWLLSRCLVEHPKNRSIIFI